MPHRRLGIGRGIGLGLGFALAVAGLHLAWAARPFCHSVPRALWLSQPEIEVRLREQGFRMVRMRLGEDRCYELRVLDPAGRFRDMILHPVTAEVMRLSP